MKEVNGYNPSKDPRLINCKAECGNDLCYAKRYGLFAEKTCPNFKEPSIVTNADKIRSMTDAELSHLLNECVCPTDQCPHYYEDRSCTKTECEKCWLDWLKQEVNE